MNRIPFFIIICFFCLSSQAEDFKKISGAFGILLNKELPKDMKFTKAGGLSKELKFRYEQKENETDFKEIIAFVHPVSKKVYSVIAFKIFQFEEDAVRFQAKLIKKVEAEYGRNIIGGTTVQGDKMVQVSYVKNRKIVLYAFTDMILRKDAHIKLGMRKK